MNLFTIKERIFTGCFLLFCIPAAEEILLYFLYLKEAPPIPSRAKDGTTTYAFSRQHSTRSTRLREKTGAGQEIIPQMNDDR